jgi:ubiquinone/menaquinone biosynthesis C-methylase UbiE
MSQMKSTVEFHKINFSEGTWHIYYPLLDSLISEGTTLLDLGCGWRDESYLKNYQHRAVCIGLDVDPNLNKQVLRLKVLADAHRLPFRDGVFDLITSVWVLEHIEKPVQYFCEAARVLREGGSLLLMTNNLCSPATMFARLLPQKFHKRFFKYCLGRLRDYDNAAVFYRANTRRLLIRHCQKAGFSSCRVIHFSGMHMYFYKFPMLSRTILRIGNLLTQNRILAFLKFNLILVATKLKPEDPR